MISREAGELMDKLQRLKTPENKEKIRMKHICQEMIEYEAKVKKWLVKFDVQMTDLEHEIQTQRESQKRQEAKTIQEIDNYELSLKNLLMSYSKEASKAGQRLQSMVTSIKDEMKCTLKENIQKGKQSIARYKTLSEKVEALIETVRNKQKKSIDDYQRVKAAIRDRANQISEATQANLEQISGQTHRLFDVIDDLERRIDQQLVKFSKSYDRKVYETNQVINSMVQYATEN